jgi:hypothetical protein
MILIEAYNHNKKEILRLKSEYERMIDIIDCDELEEIEVEISNLQDKQFKIKRELRFAGVLEVVYD